ncbi:MAG: hypothetical protein M3308_09240 [Actinomycetota bacterium]|nr:hypothetical protein [Actinomycetota bacterium]
MYGDPDQIDALARTLRGHAQRTDEHSYRIRDLARDLPWTGAAGDAFRMRMTCRAATCEVVRDDLLAAATALEHHAEQVRAVLAEIARLQEAITGWVRSALDAAADLAHRARDTRSGTDQVIEVDDYLPWKGWGFDPRVTPPPGHRDWLELGRRIGERGVAL